MLPESDYLNDVLQRLATADPDTAHQILQSAAEKNPWDARPLLLLAGRFASAQDYDRAEGLYIATLQRDPNFAIARFQLGLLQFTSARPTAAMATWAPLEQLNKSHYLRIFVEAFAHLAQDHFTETCQLLRAGMEANTENPPLNKDMDMLLQRILQSGLCPSEGSQGGAPEAAPEEAPTEPDSSITAHFLLSKYRKQDGEPGAQ